MQRFIFATLLLLYVPFTFGNDEQTNNVESEKCISIAPGSAANVSKLYLENKRFCINPKSVIATVYRGKQTIAQEVFRAPEGPENNLLGVINLSTFLKAPNVAGQYEVKWVVVFSDIQTESIIDSIVIPCTPPSLRNATYQPANNGVSIELNNLDKCNNDISVEMKIGTDVVGSVNVEAADVNYTNYFISLPEMARETIFNSEIVILDDNLKIDSMPFNFKTTCGAFEVTTTAEGNSVRGKIAAAPCHFPASISVRILNDRNELKFKKQVSITDSEFTLYVNETGSWPTGRYTVYTSFKSASGKILDLSDNIDIVCESPNIGAALLEGHAHNTQLVTKISNVLECQNSIAINSEIRNNSGLVVFNGSRSIDNNSDHAFTVSQPISIAPGDNYHLKQVVTFDGGRTVMKEDFLSVDCSKPEILGIDYLGSDREAVTAQIYHRSCKTDYNYRMSIEDDKGEIEKYVFGALPKESLSGLFLLPGLSLSDVEDGQKTVKVSIYNSESRMADLSSNLTVDSIGPSNVNIFNLHVNLNNDTGVKVPSIDHLGVTYTDPSGTLKDMERYWSNIQGLKSIFNNAEITSILKEAPSSLKVNGFIDVQNTIESHTFIGLVVSNFEESLWTIPIVSTYFIDADSDISPSGYKKGFTAAASFSNMLEGDYQIRGLSLISSDGKEIFVPSFGTFTLNSSDTQFTSSVLKSEKETIPLTISWDSNNIGRFQSSTPVKDGRYSLMLTTSDNVGNTLENGPFIINIDSPKETRHIKIPAVTNEELFVPYDPGLSFSNENKAEFVVLNGFGKVLINNSEIHESISIPLIRNSEGAVGFNVRILSNEVKMTLSVFPETESTLPLDLTLETYIPNISADLIDESVVFSAASSECGDFVVFYDLNDVDLESSRMLCGIKVFSNDTSNRPVIENSSIELASNTDRYTFMSGFIGKSQDNSPVFYPITGVVPHSNTDNMPLVNYIPTLKLSNGVNANVTSIGPSFTPGYLNVTNIDSGYNISVNGKSYSSEGEALHIPISTSLSNYGDKERIQVDVVNTDGKNVYKNLFEFIAIPSLPSLDLMKISNITPGDIELELALTAKSNDFHFSTPDIISISLFSSMALIDDNVNFVVDNESIIVSPGALEPGSYELSVSYILSDAEYEDITGAQTSSIPFNVYDGSPIKADIYSLYGEGLIPYQGNLGLTLANVSRANDIDFVIWEADSGEGFNIIQKGSSSLVILKDSPGEVRYRATVYNKHSHNSFTTENTVLKGYIHSPITYDGPSKIFTGVPVSLYVSGGDNKRIIWNIKSIESGESIELAGNPVEFKTNSVSKWLVEVTSFVDWSDGSSRIDSNVFTTIHSDWPKLPKAFIDGPVNLEPGKEAHFTIMKPSLADFGSIENLSIKQEWVLPDGNSITGANDVNARIPDISATDKLFSLEFRYWIEGLKNETMTSSWYVNTPVKYSWPKWKIYAETIDVDTPSTVRVTVKPETWKDWEGLREANVKVDWGVPERAKSKLSGPFEKILYFNDSNRFEIKAKVYDDKGNYQLLSVSSLPYKDVPFDVSLSLVPERSIQTAPLNVRVEPKFNVIPSGAKVIRTAYYLNGYYKGVTSGEAATVLIKDPGTHKIHVIAKTDKGHIEEATTTIIVEPNAPAICNVVPVGRFDLTRTVRAQCDDPDGHIVEYRWYYNGNFYTDSGPQISLSHAEKSQWRELSLVVTDNAGVESKASYLNEG